MNPSINPLAEQQATQTSETEFGGMNPDQLAAALSFSTHQGEQLLPPPDAMNPDMQMEQDPEATQDSPVQEVSEESVDPEEPEEPEEKVDLTALREEIMGEVQKTIRDEIDGLKELITGALEDDEEEKETPEASE